MGSGGEYVEGTHHVGAEGVPEVVDCAHDRRLGRQVVDNVGAVQQGLNALCVAHIGLHDVESWVALPAGEVGDTPA